MFISVQLGFQGGLLRPMFTTPIPYFMLHVNIASPQASQSSCACHEPMRTCKQSVVMGCSIKPYKIPPLPFLKGKKSCAKFLGTITHACTHKCTHTHTHKKKKKERKFHRCKVTTRTCITTLKPSPHSSRKLSSKKSTTDKGTGNSFPR